MDSANGIYRDGPDAMMKKRTSRPKTSAGWEVWSIRLSKETGDTLRRVARAEDRSVNNLVRRFVRRGLEDLLRGRDR